MDTLYAFLPALAITLYFMRGSLSPSRSTGTEAGIYKAGERLVSGRIGTSTVIETVEKVKAV